MITACGGDTSSLITLTFSPTTLPAGTINTAYSQTIKAGGGVAPYAYVVTSGTLPTGLTLNSSTGVISGTSATDGTYRFTVFSSDVQSNSGYQVYSIVISGPLPLSPASLPAGTINTAYSQTIKAGGGAAPYTYAVTSGALPAGLTLNAATGVISGTPTTDSTNSFKVTVTDSATDTGSADYSLVISGPLPISPTTLPAGTINTAYTQTISARGGVAPYTYAVTSGALPPGWTLNASTGVISGAPTTDSTYAFTITATDSASSTGSQGYSVVISGSLPISPTALPAGTLNTAYSQIIKASGGIAPYNYAVTSGALPMGLGLNASTGVLSGTPTMDGTDSFTITATDSASNAGSKGYAVVISGPLPITPATLPAGAVTTAYSQTITASSGVAPYTYSVTSGALPAGLTLNPSTGVISGTPTTSNTYGFTITATDSASNTGSQGYSVAVSGESCTVTVTATLNETNAYSQAISISYSMVGGGGGAGGGAGGWASGGGGGSSAILTGTTVAVVANGSNGGNNPAFNAGANGTVETGSFTLQSGTNLTVYVGGGGGGGGYNYGGGGGSGYFGGAGGGQFGSSDGGGGGGSSTGGIAAGDGNAQNGGSLFGGYGGPSGLGAAGGIAGAGGAANSFWDSGGGGGGYGGGGGSAINNSANPPSAGGSSGASANAVSTTPGGLGANTWSSSTTLPLEAGAGASSASGQGGNGGLVILQYLSPTGTCSL